MIHLTEERSFRTRRERTEIGRTLGTPVLEIAFPNHHSLTQPPVGAGSVYVSPFMFCFNFIPNVVLDDDDDEERGIE